MKLFGADVLCAALLFVNANAFSFDLSKRALKFDASCNTKYGSLTAKQLIDKSMDLQPKLAAAGKDSLDILITALEYQSKPAGANLKKPSVSKDKLDKIIATYRVLFGEIQAKKADGTPNPNFETEAKKHIAAIKVTRESLDRMTKSGKPNLIIHCNDDWLTEKAPKTAKAKPTEKLETGFQYLYDMDRAEWTKVKGGKPCQGNKAAVTSINKNLPTGGREKGPERITFCKEYLKRQHQLEKDKQPHLWDISKTKLPDTFTTYTQAGKKDKTLPFHISAFGKKMGAKWFHEFMHTQLFHPVRNEFSDKKIPDTQGGTGGSAYGFAGAVGLAKHKGIAESSRNIENILYWSLAMYYDQWLWSTGNPEDPETLTAPPVKAASIEEEEGDFQVDAAAKKPPKKPTKPADPPKTTAAPPPASSKADQPITSQPQLPANSAAPPASVPQTSPPASNQVSVSKPTSAPSVSNPVSGSSNSVSGSMTGSKTSLARSSCSNTLCTLTSSSGSATSSEAIPQETFESEPMNAGSMTADEIIAIAGTIASEQVAAMALWDQAIVEMDLPSETIGGDPTASLGTGLPMATGGAGGAMNGTWSMPALKARESKDTNGARQRRMYDYAS
ncbi:hypothetical protein C7974DRAFT_156682 [Boeremia exigua]|uniref:uncharacterized protein n=1 Tax=Boeremia exigua TaxID=749465 RepID=UPI001E8EC8B4|nr:uncharacterized protein C7974DRAFT_156682 [Boeremia exigua]KAH6638227.1 hypothetical protein C7974DRAFT_156682 [Boeremia exigua]